MAAQRLHALTNWITEAVLRSGDPGGDLADQVAANTGCSRRSAVLALRKLEASGWLSSTGRGRQRCWQPGTLRQVVRRYPLANLEEDLPWARDFAPCFELPAGIARMVQHAFCELLNNAVDHSGGDAVTVSVRQTPSHVQLLVSDNGLGLFDRVRQAHAIDNVELAMLELSKGLLTSQPARHSGRGLYFVARLADVFDLRANGAAYQRCEWRPGWQKAAPIDRPGTSVYVSLALDAERTLAAVMRTATSAAAEAGGFDRTQVPLKLLVSPQVALDSRAQARRVTSRLSLFREAELDFTGVHDIGHGFADELFRVFAHAHPGVDLRPVGMNADIARCVASAQAQCRALQSGVAV